MISQLQSQITDLNLRATLTITEAQVRNAYWDLVFAIDNVEAARRNLELSSKLVQDNRAKVEIGTMAPIDVVQAQAEEATPPAGAGDRRSDPPHQRAGAEAPDRRRHRRRPVERDASSRRTVPRPTPEPIDLEGAVRNALANRVDIAVAKRSLEQNEIALKNLRNPTLPALDLIGLYNLQGRGGTEFQRRPGIGGAIIGTHSRRLLRRAVATSAP